MRRSMWLAALALLCAADVMVVGCNGCNPPPPPPPDAGEPEVDAGVDAGEVDAGPDLSCPTGTDDECLQKVGPTYVCDVVVGSATEGTCIQKCKIDDDCAHYASGLRCEDKNGHCVPAQGCVDETNCAQCDPAQNPNCPANPKDYYCDPNFGVGCRCVTENNPTGFQGVCRRRHNVCEECTSDDECGDTLTFDPQGRCIALPGDPNGALPDGGTRKYCFFQTVGQCGCGMVIDPGSATCVPQSHSCDQVGCQADKDCPFGSVCNVQQCLCEPRCIWNFGSKDLNPPGCPPGKSCWVDPQNLDPNSPYFGAGRCKVPCSDPSQCQAEDPRLTCKGEEANGGGMSLNRCRPDGDCMDNFECAEKYPQPPDSIYLGYCDRASFTCKTDCRTGTDPVTNQPFDDCIGGYKCVEDNGKNICKQLTCVEQGGARLGCSAGKYCCGEDRNGDGTAEPCPLGGIEANQCYVAPAPPFCTTCMSDQDCASLPNINGSPLPAKCIAVSMNTAVCAPATFNDFTVDMNGIARAFKGCPSKYAATTIKTKCMANTDCGPNGLCDFDQSATLPDGGHPLTCLCTADGTPNKTAGCPGDPDAGTQTFCRYAPSGTQTQCIESVVCTPGGFAFKDPSEGGCGLMP